MKILTRLCMSADGYVSMPDGRPAQLADPAWSPAAFGFTDLQAGCDAVLMGRTTFEPALRAPRWPWADLEVFNLGSQRPAGTPDRVDVDSDPGRLLEKIRAANRGRNVHLVGGPRTIETYRALGALDEMRLIVLPLLIGQGLQLTPFLNLKTRLELREARPMATGAVELIYACQ